jgi:hypothetical protein
MILIGRRKLPGFVGMPQCEKLINIYEGMIMNNGGVI